ncbi:MAG TPA: flagellar basal-body rod protein FlgF [Alphaproteobacteria bacterium]|nr:flagellar basal-body rod protein FlgF [Alphaproteobacteria bacterium]
MENATYIGLSRLTVLRRQLDVVANNVANANTGGFKHQMLLVNEVPEKTRPGEKIAMVQDFATLRDLRDGPMQKTENPLDLALQGNGYFAVETDAGTRYTRSGKFQLDAEGTLLDGNGLPVLDDRDQRITIPAAAGEIRVAGDGSIATELGPVARLKLVEFERPQFMKSLGGGLYETAEEAQPAAGTRVAQFMLEGSNVNSITEITSMIDISRQYQSVQKVLENEHDRQRNAVSRLARLA